MRETGGKEVVCTPGLRLLTYSGESVYVNSEWAAFVNPWTHQIEMVVSRHTLYTPPSADSMFQTAIDASVAVVGDAEQLREHDSFVHNILSKVGFCLLVIRSINNFIYALASFPLHWNKVERCAEPRGSLSPSRKFQVPFREFKANYASERC